MLANHSSSQKDVQTDGNEGGLWEVMIATGVGLELGLLVENMIAFEPLARQEPRRRRRQEYLDVHSDRRAAHAKRDEDPPGAGLNEVDDGWLVPQLRPVGVLRREGGRGLGAELS